MRWRRGRRPAPARQHPPRPGPPARPGPGRGAGAEPGRRPRPRRDPRLDGVAGLGRRGRADAGHAVPDRLDHQDLRRGPRPAAARRGPARPRRHRGARTSRARPSATAPSCSCSATPRASPRRPRRPWWERTDGAVRPELAEVLGPRAAHARPPGGTSTTPTRASRVLGALVARLRGPVLRRGARRGGPRAARPAPDEPDAGRAARPRLGGPPVGGPAAARTRPRRRAGWPRPGSSGPPSRTSHASPPSCSTATTACSALDSLQEMREPVAATGPEGGGYGLGLQSAGGPHPLVGHGGSMPGFLAGLDLAVDPGLAVVAFANATSGPDLGALIEDLVEVVATAEPRLPAAWAPLPEADPALLALTGPWYWGAAPFAVKLARRAPPRARHARLAGTGVTVPPGGRRRLDGARRLLPRRDPAGRPRRRPAP